MNDSNKNAVVDMLFYYIYSLVKQGVEDPLQVVSTELPEMIHASMEQIEYIKMNTLQNNKLVENLDSSIELLSSIEESKTLDLESIKIVKGILEIMRNDTKVSLQKVFGGNEE
jgi:hypothetical protein